MGTPEWLHRLQDTIHENCSKEYRKEFSVDFLKAIPVGVDIEPVKSKIHIFISRNMQLEQFLLKISFYHALLG